MKFKMVNINYLQEQLIMKKVQIEDKRIKALLKCLSNTLFYEILRVTFETISSTDNFIF